MIELRPFSALGETCNDWLEAHHHFCFARYQNPERMNWGSLRVVNHNILAPGADASPHPQDNMEMISYVRRGVIAHTGSFGENHRTLAGEVRLISPGAGITHADINPGNRPAEYLEIWIAADTLGGKPKRQTMKFPRRPGQLVAVASGFPEDRHAMPLRANARVLAARLAAGVSVTYVPRPGRQVYAVSVAGRIDVNDVRLGPHDGAAIINEPVVGITALKAAEIILVDVRCGEVVSKASA